MCSFTHPFRLYLVVRVGLVTRNASPSLGVEDRRRSPYFLNMVCIVIQILEMVCRTDNLMERTPRRPFPIVS